MTIQSENRAALSSWNVPMKIVGIFVFSSCIMLAIVYSQFGLLSAVFVHRDVLAICVLSAVPLVFLLIIKLRTLRSTCSWGILAMSAAAIALSFIPGASIEAQLVSMGSLMSHIVRVVVATSLASLVISLISVVADPIWLRPTQRRNSHFEWVFSVLLLLLIPAIYVRARSRHDSMKLSEFIDQSRIGEARVQFRAMVRLSPAMPWRGRPLRAVSQDIERQARLLETQVAQPLPEHCADEIRLQRCQQLAMLDRTDEALQQLLPLLSSLHRDAAMRMSGLIYETKNQWQLARDCFQRSKEECNIQAAGPALLQTTLRLAYCDRKLGCYELAEAEYRDALTLSPTAETHFLLAQFYEDMQHAEKAREHARLAMTLDPQHYGRRGRSLIDKLIVGHFGCLNVFASEATDRSNFTRNLSRSERP